MQSLQRSVVAWQRAQVGGRPRTNTASWTLRRAALGERPRLPFDIEPVASEFYSGRDIFPAASATLV